MSRRLDTLFREKSSQLLAFFRKRIGDPGEAEDLFARAVENLDALSPGVEDVLLREEMIDALYKSLEELPPEQREVFLLQAVDGRTLAEISELTGVQSIPFYKDSRRHNDAMHGGI